MNGLTFRLYRQSARRIKADIAKHDAPLEAVRLLEALAGNRLVQKSNLRQEHMITTSIAASCASAGGGP